MIGTLDIQCNANNPNIALRTVYSFIGSPSNIRVLNVPKKIGDWKIEKVYITAQYPDNSIKSVETKLVGGCYVGTIPASTTSGKTENGFTVTASGTDENGQAVSGYVLGKGDVVVLDQDSTITVGEVTYYLHWVDSMTETPKKGDTLIVDGKLKIYNGTEWVEISGSGESYWTKTDQQLSLNGDISAVYISAYTVIDDLSSSSIPKKTSQLQNDSGFLSADQYWTVNSNTLKVKSGVANSIKLDAGNVAVCAVCDINFSTGEQGDINFIPGACGEVLIDGDRVAVACEIPTKTSDLENDSGFLSADQYWTTTNGELHIKDGVADSIGLEGCDIAIDGCEMNVYVGGTINLHADGGDVQIGSSVQIDGCDVNVCAEGAIILDTENGATVDIYSSILIEDCCDFNVCTQALNLCAESEMNFHSEGSIIFNTVCDIYLEANSGDVNITASGKLYYNEEEVATVCDIPTKTSDLQNDSGFLTQHQSLTAYATKTHVSQNYVQKVSGSENNIVLFDSLGKIKDSGTQLASLATKDDLNYSYESRCITQSDPCIMADSGTFTNVVGVEPSMTAAVYLGDYGFSRVADTMIQFNYTSITSDAELPQINWYANGERNNINWKSIEGDTVEHGNEYLYMIQTYINSCGYNGIMSIRKLNSAE